MSSREEAQRKRYIALRNSAKTIPIVKGDKWVTVLTRFNPFTGEFNHREVTIEILNSLHGIVAVLQDGIKKDVILSDLQVSLMKHKSKKQGSLHGKS